MMLVIAVPCVVTMGQVRDTRSDTWVAIDELQRAVADSLLTGAPNDEKLVGLFYYIWHNEESHLDIHDISKILKSEESWGPHHAFHHWGEPLYGYYSSQDEFVIRKHMQMIIDAGVDFIFIDNTNAFTYTPAVLKILATLKEMKTEGYRIPLVTFILYNGDMDAAIERLHNDVYSQGEYEDLFFRWEGKPLIIGRYEGELEAIDTSYNYKLSWAWTELPWFTDNQGEDRWPWLANHPQEPGLKDGIPEQITVTTAQHPVGEYAIGKSCGADRTQEPEYGADGKYFNLQWQRALEVDPPVVMITQWNEWMAQRFIYPDKDMPVTHMLREPLKVGQSIFVDAYSAEYSRDIEPLRTDYRDNMYLQMVSNIRKYKGARSLEPAGDPASIQMDAGYSQWIDIAPSYLDDVSDTEHRNHQGYGSDSLYTNQTGRNDLDELKVSFDSANLYFYARTVEPISDFSDTNWMMLLLNTDLDYTTGWHGYDFIVNDTVLTSDTTTLRQYTPGNLRWSDTQYISYNVSGNEMQIRIPSDYLNINTGGAFVLDFKWVDNSIHSGDIIDLYLDGDAAPNSRFNYRFMLEGAVIPPGQEPFTEKAFVIPGILQTENFDAGGIGIAYHDTDTVNQGLEYRISESVDISITTDSTGDFEIGWIETGEWLEYIVTVLKDGRYDLGIRAASDSDSNLFHIEMNGIDISGPQFIHNTGGTGEWATLDTAVDLSSGSYILKIIFDDVTGDLRMNYLDFYLPPTYMEIIEAECRPRLEWDFLENNECWSLVNNLEGSVSDGIFTLTVTDHDPHMLSYGGLTIAARAYNTILVRMRNLTNDSTAQFYWIRSDNPGWNEAMSIDFNILPEDDSLREYLVDLSEHSEWKGLVTQLRFDPARRASEGSIELDHISVRYGQNTTAGSLAENRGLLISPNPASRMVEIGSEIKGKQQVILTDLSGRTVYMQTYWFGTEPVTIRLENIPPGIYIITVLGKQSIQNGRLITR